MNFRVLHTLVTGLRFLAAIGVVVFAGADCLFAERITMEISDTGVNSPVVTIDLRSDATAGYETPQDARFIPTPTRGVDFFSSVPYDPYQLSRDGRDPSNYTFDIQIWGRDLLTDAPSANLDISITNPRGESLFLGRSIFLDLYDASDGGLIQTYTLANSVGTTLNIPLDIQSGSHHLYDLGIRFADAPEPSALTLSAIAAAVIVFGWWRRRRLGPRAT